MIRPASLIAVVLAAQLAACDRAPPAERDPAEQAARSAIDQLALFCPNEDFSWEAFEAMARRLDAKPDDGAFRRPPTFSTRDIVRERWVALDHLGYRTTVWIGELGPGRLNLGTSIGFTTTIVDYSDALVCAVHDPTLSREQAFAPTREWTGGQVTGAQLLRPDDPTSIIALVKTWTNSAPGADFYQDFEIRLRRVENHDGALFIRHRYNYAP
ncbi:MAG: hypothetical protein V7678_00075 [Brevundimonas sp.]